MVKGGQFSSAGDFFGRDDDRHEVTRLVTQALADEGPHLITVVGPGGVGKTRFCTEVLRDAVPPNALIAVDLTVAETPAGVVGAVAEGLSLSPDGGTGEALTRRCVETLKARDHVVVFLDNAEHVRDPLLDLVETMLREAPHSVFVVTSREPLGARGEYRYELVPLEDEDAVALFVARAQSARPGFVPDESERAALLAVVAQLSCLPLAIELAAARMEVLSIAQLAQRLERPFALLKGGGRGTTERHRTLWATLEWSWDLLDEEERRAFCWCAVFHGPFSLERAEAVLPEDMDAIDVLQRLKRKSLLSFRGAPRNQFYFLESIKAFARKCLAESGEHDDAHERHAGVLIHWAKTLDARDVDTLQAVKDASEDIIAAINTFAGAEGDAGPAQAADLLCRVHRYLRRIVVADTAMSLLNRVHDALQATRKGAPLTGAAVSVLNARAQFAVELGHLTKAEADIARVLDDEAATPSAQQKGRALGIRAALLTNQGKFEAARADLDDAVGLLGDEPADLARMQLRRFVTYLFEENYDEAERIGGLAQLAVEQHGDPEDHVYTLVNLAYLRAERGKLQATKRDLLQALELARQYTSRTVCGIVEINLAWTDLDLENRDAALGYCNALSRDAKAHGLARLYGLARFLAGIAHAEEGRSAEAITCFLDAEAHQAELDTVARARFAPRAYRACVLAHLGRDTEAKALLSLLDDEPLDLPLLKDARRLLVLATHVLLKNDPDTAPDPTVVAAAKTALAALGENTVSGPVRIARRWLVRALHTRDVEHPPTAGRRIRLLEVERTGAWFRVDDAPVVDIHRRGAMKRVLEAIVQAHKDRPGAALSLDEVFSAGWPGQDIAPGAAANRVYTVIRNLRRAGLDAVLVTRDDGYLLNPLTAVTRRDGANAP